MSWFESPQYLKSIQKIRAMPPEDKAVTQTLVDELSGLYAGADMQKQLQAMRFATQKKSREDELRVQRGRLDLSKQGLGISKDYLDLSGELRGRRQALAEEEFDYGKDAADTAQNLGWANIGLSGLFGYQGMRDKKKEAQRWKTLMEQAYGSQSG
jgi:hypothetical protein